MPRYSDPADGSWLTDERYDRDTSREPPTPARTLTADDRRETLRLNFESAFVCAEPDEEEPEGVQS